MYNDKISVRSGQKSKIRLIRKNQRKKKIERNHDMINAWMIGLTRGRYNRIYKQKDKIGTKYCGSMSMYMFDVEIVRKETTSHKTNSFQYFTCFNVFHNIFHRMYYLKFNLKSRT